MVMAKEGRRRLKKMDQPITTIAKFNTLCAARRHQNHAKKIVMLVLGDDRLIWSVTPAVGERLVREGYEYAA
jgi:hypothetical protein